VFFTNKLPVNCSIIVHRSAPNRVKIDINFPMARFFFLLYYNPGLKPGATNMAPSGVEAIPDLELNNLLAFVGVLHQQTSRNEKSATNMAPLRG
jgi:hypothetical protein